MRDHFQDRMKERGILFPDALNALKKARSCTPYLSIGGAAHGGTEWRVTGPSLDDDEPTDIVIGVEAGTNEQSRYMWLVTVLPRRATKKKGGVK